MPYKSSLIKVIIPTLNEEQAIGHVLSDIPAQWVDEIIVVNNNSSDRSPEIAREHGATVLDEPRRGYGNACLKGIAHIKTATVATAPPEIIVFMDADYSDYPAELPSLVRPLLEEGYDLVIGSRTLGKGGRQAMLPQQVMGNRIATTLLRLLYGVKYTDLGPFRAIRWKKLLELDMQDKTFGWTVEMQLKAARQGLRITEVPVSYRKRIGTSKISGTLKGSVLAGCKIIGTIFKYI